MGGGGSWLRIENSPEDRRKTKGSISGVGRGRAGRRWVWQWEGTGRRRPAPAELISRGRDTAGPQLQSLGSRRSCSEHRWGLDGQIPHYPSLVPSVWCFCGCGGPRAWGAPRPGLNPAPPSPPMPFQPPREDRGEMTPATPQPSLPFSSQRPTRNVTLLKTYLVTFSSNVEKSALL